MGIRIALISGVLLVSWWFLHQRNNARSQAGKKILLVAFAVVAIVAIIDPGLTDVVARALGVGRGADLILYSLTLAFIFVTLNSYLKFKELEDRLVELARATALERAVPPPRTSAPATAPSVESAPPREPPDTR
jgi:small membrane protein